MGPVCPAGRSRAVRVRLRSPRHAGRATWLGGTAMRAREVVGGAVAVVLAAAIPLAASLAGNAATEAARWPGVLDVLRRHPWASLAVMLVLTGALLALDRRREAASARPAPPPSV
ncbi:hypothetical protein, partial [Streptomyces sp. McG5]